MADAEDMQTEGPSFTEIVVNDSLKIEQFDPSHVVNVKANLEALGANKVEAVFDPELNLVAAENRGGLQENGFITAVRTAYSSHVPLSLSPDHFWTLISQGISKHIEKNAEKFRDKFVDFDGKKIIRIIRDGFVKGSPDNNWAGCFTEFSTQIETFIGEDMKKKLCPNFSTTSATAKACHELGLMDCLKSYFQYRVRTRCGISKVQLQGSVEDWKQLESSLSVLEELELSEWGEILKPILNNLSRAASGENTDEHFWATIYKAHLGGGSGAHPAVDGWCSNFFLYVNDNIRKIESFRSLDKLYEEATAEKKRRFMFHNPGVPQKAIPVGLSKTPFIWEYLGTDIPMYFYGGFVGAKFDEETGYVTPQLGWAVGEQPKSGKND